MQSQIHERLGSGLLVLLLLAMALIAGQLRAHGPEGAAESGLQPSLSAVVVSKPPAANP